MPFAIDSQFSVFHLVERIESRSNLLNHRRTMSLVSYEIENATLIDGARTRIFSGFQYFSKFTPQLERYRRLAQRAESIYVFGVPDVELPSIPNLTFVPLSPGDQLSKEWFLISYGVDFFSALATEELTPISDPDPQRMFKGIWTFDVSLVSILADWLTSTVGAHTLIIGSDGHNFVRQVELMAHGINRLTAKMAMLQSSPFQRQIHAEVNTAIQYASTKSE